MKGKKKEGTGWKEERAKIGTDAHAKIETWVRKRKINFGI